jgi:hypothetical protein
MLPKEWLKGKTRDINMNKSVESSDGAMQGLSANDALKVILGGQSEDDQVHMYPEEFEKTIRHAPAPPWDYSNDGYSQCANWLARQILEWLEKDPINQTLPVDTEYVWFKHENGEIDWNTEPTKSVLGWSDLMKEDGYFPDGMYGCTGFQWGWACNAARKIVGLTPAPNPAIMTIGGNNSE